MRVLVLRPQPAAGRTARKLAGMGHEPVLLPLSKAEHDVAAVMAALAKPHDSIAVTSAEVARLFAKVANDLAPHLATRVFAVGPATADALRAVGFRSVEAAGGNGEMLAQSVIAHYRTIGPPRHPLLYLAGSPRAQGFEKNLHEASISYRTVESYRMLPLALSPDDVAAALIRPGPDTVLLYSPESARAFFQLAPLVETPERFPSLRFLCMSRNVAAIVPERFAARTEVAVAPDEASMLALL